MNLAGDGKCDKCGSDEFISNLNKYDILAYYNGKFHIISSEFAEIDCQIFCRDCGEAVNTD